MPIYVSELRKSWIWFDSYAGPLSDHKPSADLASRLSWEDEYGTLFEGARDNQRADSMPTARNPLTLPWPPQSGSFNYFWLHYLEKKDPELLTPRSAWKQLLPLRLRIQVDPANGSTIPGFWVETRKMPCRLRLEAYFLPHGVGLVATAYVSPTSSATRAKTSSRRTAARMTLPKAVDRIHACYDTAGLRLVDANRGKQGPTLKLPFLAPRLLNRLRSWAGVADAPELRSGPFSVATIVKGKAGLKDQAVQQDSPLHRALHGLCGGGAAWAQSQAPPLAESKLETRQGPDFHVLLREEHARAVWFPSAFDESAGNSSLSCYHRNLTMLSLQIEALLGLITLAHNDLRAGNPVRSGRLEDLSKRAAQHLGRLYGQKSTYTSASAPAQIDADGRKSIADAVRKNLGVGDPLHR